MADTKKETRRTPQDAIDEVAEDKARAGGTHADGHSAAVPRNLTEAPRTTTVDAGALEGAMRARADRDNRKGAGANPEKLAKAAGRELTEVQSHKAIKRGYANGIIVEPGDYVPAGVPVSDYYGDTPGQSKEAEGHEGWMLPADDKRIAEAIGEATE